MALATLPFINNKSVNKIKIENEWVKQTLKVWAAVKKSVRIPESISRAMPILGNLEFPPSVWDSGFQRWADRGLIIINQLFDGTYIKSFSQLQEQFRLSPKDL